MNRRRFLQAAALGVGALGAKPADGLHVGTNTYPWGQFARREGKPFVLHGDEALAAIASTGITGYEPIINRPQEFDGLKARLEAHGLQMRSIYVNSTLHDPKQVAGSIDHVLAIARRAADLGTRIIVTNPAPIKWGGTENKSDAQLIAQAEALNQLGEKLRKLGITLAYHNHDSELRMGARELHHMLTATDPENVKFCLDAHWVYRGCGNSQVALFDVVEHHGGRIVELHLRQSRDGTWTEVFTEKGDIDYTRLAGWLQKHRLTPHIVLEQAVENGSPNTLTAIEAHRKSVENVRQLFGSR